MKTIHKIFFLSSFIFIYIVSSIYIFVLLPQKINTVNNTIISSFKEKIYPNLKESAIQVEKKIWWLNINISVKKNFYMKNIGFLDKYFIFKIKPVFNFYWNLCNGNKVCLLNLKNEKEQYIIYPLYKSNIPFVKTLNLEIICKLNNNKCYIYNINNWMKKPLILSTQKYNNMFYIFDN